MCIHTVHWGHIMTINFGNLEVEDELLQITIIMVTFCLCFHYPKPLNTKFSPVNQL